MPTSEKPAKWTHVQSWHRYPYAVHQVVGVDGWCVSWHANTGASGGIAGRARSYPTPEEAMAGAEAHGDANGWRPQEFVKWKPRAFKGAAHPAGGRDGE